MPARIIPANASANAEYGLRFIMAKSFCLKFYLVLLLPVLLFIVVVFSIPYPAEKCIVMKSPCSL